jgi:hypothetical protein
MSQKNILFLVHTEYHLIVALSVIADKYLGKSDYNIIVLLTESGSSSRFSEVKNLSDFENIVFRKINYSESEFKYNSDLHKLVLELLSQDFSTLVIFNQHGFLPIYLSKKFAEKGTKVCLAPDGAKAYVSTKGIAPRWSIKTAIKLHRFLIANKLFLNRLHIPTLTYADLKEIDEVWVQYDKDYRLAQGKKIVGIDVLKSKDSFSLVNSIFGFSPDTELHFTGEQIFYINQPVAREDFYNYEFTLLKKLTQKFPDHKLIVKLHPLTEEHQVERFKTLQGTSIITKAYPAELYIAQLENSIVLSFWSTACLIHNESVRTYWAYPMLKHAGIQFKYLNISSPTEHIIEAENIDMIR